MGTVVDVFNSGMNDLLRVRLNSFEEMLDRTGSSNSEKDGSAPLVWVPFVEAIVPDVDMTRREIHITPPKGLLELNLRSDWRSKKERRQLVSTYPLLLQFIIYKISWFIAFICFTGPSKMEVCLFVVVFVFYACVQLKRQRSTSILCSISCQTEFVTSVAYSG